MSTVSEQYVHYKKIGNAIRRNVKQIFNYVRVDKPRNFLKRSETVAVFHVVLLLLRYQFSRHFA